MKKIYVGNLSYQTDEQQLESLFGEYGAIAQVTIIRDPASGTSRGFGFVEMGTDSEAQAAIEALNGQTLDGRTLNVNEARPRAPRKGGGFREGRGGHRGR